MSLLGGILKSVVNPMTLVQLATGPAGWASLAMRALGSAIGQQVIQQLGQRLGLPQSVINMAQNTFAAMTGTQGGLTVPNAVSQLADQFNLSPVQQGQLQRSALQDVSRMVDDLASDMGRSPETRTPSGGKSWLMAIAESLGRTADKLAKEMDTMSQQLGKGDESSKASDNLKFGAKSQEFSQFFSSANTVIKSMGEALASGARKQ